MFKSLLIFSLFLIHSVTWGAPSCLSLFHETQNAFQKSILDPRKLTQQKLRLDEDNNIYDMITKQLIGKIDVIETDGYLYEWAPLDYQQAWVANGSISASEMRGILKEKGQASGKGYYVSTDPFDSSHYGDGLTIFKTKGPVIRLALQSSSHGENSALLLRLQKAGVDALEGTQNTWFAMISHRHLVVATEPLSDPVWRSPYGLAKTLAIRKKFEKSDLSHLLPDVLPKNENDLLRRLKSFIDHYRELDPTTFHYTMAILAHHTSGKKADALRLQLIQKEKQLLATATPIQLQELMILAVERLDPFAIELLLDQQAPTDILNRRSGGNLVMTVAALKNPTLLKRVLSLNVDKDHQNTTGKTALMIVSAIDWYEGAEILLAAGANPHLRDKEYKPARYYAWERGNKKLNDLLQDYENLTPAP